MRILRAGLTLMGFILIALVYQNCSNNDFKQVRDSAQASEGQFIDEVIVDACYEITCTSLAERTQTMIGSGKSENIITAEAPSGMGTWVLRVNQGVIAEAVNCFSDYASTELKTDLESELCVNHGPSGGSPAPYDKFKKGKGNPFQQCLVADCP